MSVSELTDYPEWCPHCRRAAHMRVVEDDARQCLRCEGIRG